MIQDSSVKSRHLETLDASGRTIERRFFMPMHTQTEVGLGFSL